MNKRRRTSSVTSSRQDESECGESDSQSLPEPTTRKRRKVELVTASDLCQQVYDIIRNHRKEDGGVLCDAFIRAPKRRQEPAYYDVVSNPMDFIKIQQKIKTDEYQDLDDMSADVELLVNNAKAFHKRSSQEHKDAADLWELFNTTKNKILDAQEKAEETEHEPRRGRPPKAKRAPVAEISDDTSESWCASSIDDEVLMQCEDLFQAVMTTTDNDGRLLYPPFQLLPSKKIYPKYYEVIENPIDLRMIANKIQRGKYSSLEDLKSDLMLLTRNATYFNEPGSQIYMDAKALRRVVKAKKKEVEQSKNSPGKASERIRNKRLRGAQTASAITAALRYEDEDSDDERGGDNSESAADGDEPDNPQWQLYNAVRNTTNNQGVIISEPFWKLPSKRYYPDYYKEIKTPISLMQIRNKLQKGEYGTVSEVAGDMNIMFENAKKYNRPECKLYKDAVRLQKAMQNKVQELLDFQQDSDSEEDSDEGPKRPRKKVNTPGSARKPKNLQLKRKLLAYGKALINYVCEDGRQPILLFMEKPSRKLYADYYEVITNPIDMLTIEANIRNEKYSTEEEALEDFKLMFNNCRTYNEESSLIYEDANNLERVLLEKVRELSNGDGSSTRKTPKTIRQYGRHKGRKSITPGMPLPQKMRILYDTIRDYKDPKGRQLSVIFMKLPLKTEYPDYYEIIKRPIDLEKISQKLKNLSYETMDDLVGDFILMFDNACKYNEPDSQIYKAALMLQRVALQTKMQLREDEDTVPDVPGAVQDLLISLFTSFYNHQDEEGRCFSDSMAELQEHDDVDGKKVRALSLDMVKQRLNRGLYRRLDAFQEDIFSVMERARSLSRTDSQVFEDSVELQSFFIRQRDELCRGGDLLQSPALNYSLITMSEAVEQLRQQKAALETPEEDGESCRQDMKPVQENGQPENAENSNVEGFRQESTESDDSSMTFNQQVYSKGDFVYVEPRERGMDLSIIHIERLWVNQEGKQMLYGNFYFRPNETYHVTTRRFLEKEVFKSDVHGAVPLKSVLGRCAVLFVKDYFRSKPEGFDDNDIYVCESRYSTRARAFKKIKVWTHNAAEHYKLINREETIEPKRIMSVFRERVEKHKEEIAELEECEKLPEKVYPDLICAVPDPWPGFTYYEQYNASFGVIRTGDFVYVLNQDGSKSIALIDSIYKVPEQQVFVRGPWLVHPNKLPPIPNRLYYKQEVFLTSSEGCNLLSHIVGRCAVLEHHEYISVRPTEIPESDVFICESAFDESSRQTFKIEGLRKYSHTRDIYEDELYYFRRLLNPPKVRLDSSLNIIDKTQMAEATGESGLLTKMALGDPDMMMEDSLDGGPPSVGSGDIATPSNTNSASNSTPVSSKKVKASGKKLVTGYILYSSDARRSAVQSYPDSSFGEVSRIVGNEWRNLPQEVKTAWEEKAARMNEEAAAKQAEAEANCPSPAPSNTSVAGNASGPAEPVWECCWDNCDWQFEDLSDCVEHTVAEGTGHVYQSFQGVPASECEWQCQWRGCNRLRKGAQPFPNVQRLARHVREVHIAKTNGKPLPIHERSRNYVPSKKSAAAAAATPKAAVPLQNQTQGFYNHGQGGPNQNNISRPPDPLFVSVPPRPHRLLHSEAYIKYIEGLSVDNKTISNWERHLKATPENTPPPDPTRLPGNWLGNGIGNHGNLVNALWALREFMVRDALGISKLV